MSKKILLGQGRYDARYTKYAHLGLYALVDDGDFAKLDQYQWSAAPSGRSRTLYATTKVAGRQVKMHRLIMNARPGEEIDHRDNNGLNNTRQNLRRCTHQQNLTKQRVQMRPKHSVYKGVTWDKQKGKWMAYIKVRGRMKFLGYHPTQEDAARAYDAAAKEAFGEYVWLNFPEATEVLEEGCERRVCGRSLSLKAARPFRNDCRKRVALEVGQILKSGSWYSELNPLSESMCRVCGHDAHRTQSHSRSMLYAERLAWACCGARSGKRETGC